ncbi:MAG: hypothetical protein JKY86_07650 [Gammaproteobacteria bacterium]|nr:hypothetical protein [Gammaproteobacteria bacterium]
MILVNLSQFVFDQAPVAALADAIANDLYTSPLPVALNLGQVTRLSYVDAELVGSIVLSAVDTASFDIRVTDGVTDFHTESVTLTAVDRLDFKVAGLNLKRFNGSSPVYVQVDVTEPAAAAVTFQLFASLRLEFPQVVVN